MIESRKDFYKFLALFSAACIAYLVAAWKVICKIVPRKTIVIIAALLLTGCASMTYTSPDGTTVTYTRFMTGSDTIKGKLPGASIESHGQKSIDPTILELLLKALETAK